MECYTENISIYDESSRPARIVSALSTERNDQLYHCGGVCRLTMVIICFSIFEVLAITAACVAITLEKANAYAKYNASNGNVIYPGLYIPRMLLVITVYTFCIAIATFVAIYK